MFLYEVLQAVHKLTFDKGKVIHAIRAQRRQQTRFANSLLRH